MYRSVSPNLTSEAVPLHGVVGWAGTLDSPRDSGRFAQEIATIGKLTRDERGTIGCLIRAQTGGSADADIVATETRAFTALGDVEGLIRADPNLGLSPNPRLYIQLEAAGAIRTTVDTGIVCDLEFTVIYSARI